MDMAKVLECEVTQCCYNNKKQCHALAITVGDADHPHCDTFFRMQNKGGDPAATAGVGACKVVSCRYNGEMECQAPGIRVGHLIDDADCQTFQKR